MKKILIVLLLSFLPFSLIAADKEFSQQELDQMMAPIALYPDSLLSQILIASTYPDQVEEAVRWSKHNTTLEGEEAVRAVEDQNWDPSVTSLVAFPQVLDMMGKKTYWVQQLGDAFLAQPDSVMDSVQHLRIKAKDAGNLKSSQKQKVEIQDNDGAQVVVIEPASPRTIYVPVYDPMYVYGPWMYPAYVPFFYYPSYFYMAPGIYFGFSMGIIVGNIMWGGFHWPHHDVYINVPRYNSVYIHRKIYVNDRTVSWKNRIRYNNPRALRYYKTGQHQNPGRLTDRRFINYDNFEKHETTKRSGTSYNNGTKNQDSRVQSNRQTTERNRVQSSGQTTERNRVQSSGQTTERNRVQSSGQTTERNRVQSSGQTTERNRVQSGGQTTERNKVQNSRQPTERNKVSNQDDGRNVLRTRESKKDYGREGSGSSNKGDGHKGDRGR